MTAKKTEEQEVKANVEVSEEEDKDAKCDNHPGRKAHTFTGGGSYEIHLCDECTPPHFKDQT